MKDPILQTKPQALSPFLLKSVLLHLAVCGLIATGLLQERRDILEQEQEKIVEIRSQEQQAESEERRAKEEMHREMLEEQLRVEFDDLIAEELEQVDEQNLEQLMYEDLAERIDLASAETDWWEISVGDLEQLLGNIRAASFEQLRINLEELQKKILFDVVRSHVRSQVAPQIKQQIEMELKHNLGNKVKGEMTKQLALAAQAVQSKSAAAGPAGADLQPREIQRAIAQAAMDQAETAVRNEIEGKVKEQAIPAAAERMTQALGKSLHRFGMDSAEFREQVKKEIAVALETNLGGQRVDGGATLLKAQEAFQTRGSEGLEAARTRVAEALEGLKNARQEEENLQKRLTEETARVESGNQQALAEQIGDQREKAEDALRAARVETFSGEGIVDEAAKELKKRQAENDAASAAEAAQRGMVEEAQGWIESTKEHLDRSISHLQDVEKVLGQEIQQINSQAALRQELTQALGEQQAGKRVQDAQHSIETVTRENAGKSIALAVQSVDFQGLVNTMSGIERVARAQMLQKRLEQVAQNVKEGREMTAAGMSLAGSSGTEPFNEGTITGLGADGESYQRFRAGRGRRSPVLNREVYEEFVKDLRNRLKPENYYGEAEETWGLASSAPEIPPLSPAKIFVESRQDQEKDKPEEEQKVREVPPPKFHYKAFAAAAMVERPLRIDGDLSDWGELRHPIPMQYRGTSMEKIEDGPILYMRWSPEGLYFCTTVKDTNGIQPNPHLVWNGDCLEVWIDTVNSRLRQMEVSPSSHQFCFTPFGFAGNPNISFSEIGRNFRGLKMFHAYTDEKKTRGESAAKILPGHGYTLEAFLKRQALARPLLVPGQYIAANFSVNVGYDHGNHLQWSASKAIVTWDKPDTWGDILLLGSDAKARWISFDSIADPRGPHQEAAPGNAAAAIGFPKAEKPLEGVVPGQPMEFEILDKDMDLSPHRRDRVAAEVKVKNVPGALVVILAETDNHTGIFRGSIATQHYFQPAKKDTLNIRSGDCVQLVYRDQRSAFGETDRVATAETMVGWPVMEVGQK